MVLKRKKIADASSSLTTQFNRSKFVSFDAQKKYNDSLPQ